MRRVTHAANVEVSGSALAALFGFESNTSGTFLYIGQIAMSEIENGDVVLCHRDDVGRDNLQCFSTAESAIDLARYDDGGAYRPLKTAPNLRRGWKLILAGPDVLRRALDLFYPGRLAVFFAQQTNQLTTTPLRQTLNRQTGMYRAAAKISDPELDALVGDFCRSDGGCLRTILWKRDTAGTQPSSSLPPEKFNRSHDQVGAEAPAVPLLCQEACNLLIAAAREVVRGERETSL